MMIWIENLKFPLLLDCFTPDDEKDFCPSRVYLSACNIADARFAAWLREGRATEAISPIVQFTTQSRSRSPRIMEIDLEGIEILDVAGS